jgi:cytoskeleton protein RodZ
MQAIGDRLREARMRQKIDIAEVETATKIRAKYLRALENEEFGLLPGSTFVKSFLRTYAEYLGLDPHLLVEEYRAQHEPREQAELQPFGAPPSGRERRGGGGPPGPLVVVVGLVLLLIVGLAVLGLTGGDGDDDSADQGAREQQQEDPGETSAERRERRERAAAEVSRVRVSADSDLYVCVDDSEGRDRELTINGSETFRGRRVRVLLARRDARVTLNGERVRVEAGPDPIAFEFSRGRSREITLARAPC